MVALALKELRETAGIAAVALALYLALVASLAGIELFNWVPGMPGVTREVPFVGEQFTRFYTLVSAIFAMALGFRMSAWESVKGTYLFLLHRPVPRGVIFGAKLVSGMILFLTCASVPILLYASWAAVPGAVPCPFEWSMTAPAWRLAVLMPLLFLGAFLSGLRPARWLGTRLLPLVACALLTLFLNIVPWWWQLGLPIAILAYALLVLTIVYVARTRDYS